jgi:hypothetical protein
MKVDKLSASCQLKGNREVTKDCEQHLGSLSRWIVRYITNGSDFPLKKKQHFATSYVLFLHNTRHICTLFKWTEMFRTIAVYPQGGVHFAYTFTVYRMLQLRKKPK